MVDKVIGTFFSRLIVIFVMLVVVVINTNTFGAEGVGTISLIILGLTYLQLISCFLGGGTLVYLIPRNNLFQILFLTYLWGFFSNIVGLLILYFLKLIPAGFEIELLILSMLNTVFYINTTVMQGKEEIKKFNIFQILQGVLVIVSLSVMLLVCKFLQIKPDVQIYIYAVSISYLIPTLFSFSFIIKNVTDIHTKGMGKLLKKMVKLGLWVQVANFSQLLNYRLNYYLIEWSIGKKTLGIFDLGTKLSEAVLNFPRSICLVQYARLANNDDAAYAKRLTLGLFKISFVFSAVLMFVLVCIPADVLGFVFGKEFSEAKIVIYTLAPGIVFLSCLSILSNHFAGYGKYWVNSITSMIGLTVTLGLGIVFIPEAAKTGYLEVLKVAGLIMSLSYLASLIFILIVFVKKTGAVFSDFIITKAEMQLFRRELVSNFVSLFKKKA